MKYIIEVKCDDGHVQNLYLQNFIKVQAQTLAGLMDGTSSLYVYSPLGDPNSLIAKCGICSAPIKCTVKESLSD